MQQYYVIWKEVITRSTGKCFLEIMKTHLFSSSWMSKDISQGDVIGTGSCLRWCPAAFLNMCSGLSFPHKCLLLLPFSCNWHNFNIHFLGNMPLSQQLLLLVLLLLCFAHREHNLRCSTSMLHWLWCRIIAKINMFHHITHKFENLFW